MITSLKTTLKTDGTSASGSVPPAGTQITRSPVKYRASGSSTTEWLNVVLAPILNRASGAEARQLAVAADRAPIPLVYGEDRVGALVLNVVPSGANVLVQCVWALAGDSVNDIKYNDLALPAAASVDSYDGSQVTVDTELAAAFTANGITYAEALTGYMYSVITMPQSAFSGSLAFSARIKGRKCYDPRSGLTVWTDCPALHLRDFLTSTAYGCGKTVDDSTVTTTANANDALVSGTEKRRLSGIAFVDQQPVKTVAEILRAHAGCFLVPGSAGIKLVPDATRATDATYAHASGQIANLVRVTKKDVGNVPTVVEVIYTDTSVYPWRDASAVVEASGVDTTVPRRLSQVRMPGVHRYSQATREATERLNKLRTSDLEVVLDVFDQGIAHEAGDVIEVTHPVGLTSKKLRVADPEAIGPGLWRLTCAEYDPAAYSDSLASAPTYNDTNLANPTVVPPNLSAFSVTVLADGTRRFAITAPAGAPAGSSIVVRYVTGSSSTWSAMSQLFTLVYDPNVTAYTYETALPIQGTWSFGAKLVNPFGTECATAQFISAAVLTSQPKRYDATFNLLLNADFTHDLGSAYNYPNAFNDARALAHWTAGASTGTSSYYRNYNGGNALNVGMGGCVVLDGTRVGTGSAAYTYLYSDPFPVSSGQVYEASVYANPTNCPVELSLAFYNTGGTGVSSTGGGETTYTGSTASGGGVYAADIRDPMIWPRLFEYGTAPGTGYVRAILLKYSTLTTGSSDWSAVAWHKAQICKHGGGTSAAEAMPWVPSNATEPGEVYTRGLGANAATEVYTAVSSGTGRAYHDDYAGTGAGYCYWTSQECNVAVPVEAGDKLAVHVNFAGACGDAASYLRYCRIGVDMVTSWGTGTQWYFTTGATGNRQLREDAVGSLNQVQNSMTTTFDIGTTGTATVYAGAGARAGSSYGTSTESGITILRVERIRR